jgi:TonB family protein
MRRIFCVLFLFVIPATWCGGVASAQPSSCRPAQEERTSSCSGPVYKAGDVSRKAKIIDYPPPASAPEDEGNWKESGRVVLRAVLCRTGEVTDIEVVEGLPDGLTEKAVEAARRIKFNPAERRGQKVYSKTARCVTAGSLRVHLQGARLREGAGARKAGAHLTTACTDRPHRASHQPRALRFGCV